MKIVLSIYIVLINSFCKGQTITVDNTWKAGSQMIFIGVENKLILRGDIRRITKIEASKAFFERLGDTLILKPTQPGDIEVLLKTTRQPITLQFTATYLPMFSLVITDDSLHRKDVRKEEILTAKNIYLISNESNVKLYEDYLITECILHIDNRNYQSSGNSLSAETKKAIAELKQGSVIKVEQVTAKSKSTGKEIKLKANQTFTLL
jgi:hypothetical protein